MLDPSPFARPARRLTWITCIALASVIWPINALADDPNQDVTTGVPIVDVILKLLGAIYVLLSTILLMLPKTSKLALGIATIVADWKGVVAQNAAVKEAKTGAMAEKIRRESTMPPPGEATTPPTIPTIPPPRGFAGVSILGGLSVVALGVVAFGLLGCKETNVARTACDIVHIIDDGCDVFVKVPLPDGTVEKVPRAEIVKLARTTKAVRLSSDGGAP